MSEPKDPTHEAYQRARDAFDELNIEKKATFLVEAAVSTLARGLASASEALGSEFERAFETMEAEAAADETTEEAAASEPKAKTTKRASSAKKTTSTAKKASSTRTRSTRKTPPPKKS